jgi:hypothetical protein
MTDLSGKIETGSHSYTQGQFTITRMASDEWYVFDGAGRDTGLDFTTLAAARKYISSRPAKTVVGRY